MTALTFTHYFSDERAEWDKMHVPDVFMKFFNNFILKLATYPGLKKDRKSKKNPKTTKFANTRSSYFLYMGKIHTPTMYESIKLRHKLKKDFWTKNQVILQ